ncbi:hypothetical protein Pmani_028338 [Petrolisthes manimaculis]|uniref:Uncharacterized protein n=1 Tax=Petrolisthes manimaculis TaxID=1843537 RepID=A0AAE1P2B1_9EUCA|nr:hypothetical protein Pmani_028338 [Petrolisthes manimaculis]
MVLEMMEEGGGEEVMGGNGEWREDVVDGDSEGILFPSIHTSPSASTFPPPSCSTPPSSTPLHLPPHSLHHPVVLLPPPHLSSFLTSVLLHIISCLRPAVFPALTM